MTDQNIGTDVTDTSQNQDQDAGKVYTQKEVDDLAARLKSSVAKKYEKQFGDVDVEEYRSLKTQAEKAKQDEAMRRGEFETILKDLAAKKDSEISKRDALIRDFKLNTPLLETAAKFKAIAPEQVKALLKDQVRLDEEGNPIVVDNTGKIKYTDKGTPLSVEDLVQDFLNQNPHFVAPTPTTTNSKSSHTAQSNKIDITKMDMNNPEHRDLYKQYRKEHGLA
jgi:hypothetical protein